jgi:uncharacterized protein YukE
MGDHVDVDVTELHHAGHQIADWHIDTERAFTSDHQAMEESVASGWVGSSADAMSQRLQTMRAAGTAIAAGLNGHSTHMSSAAYRYSQTEGESARTLQNITRSDDDKPLLDL